MRIDFSRLQRHEISADIVTKLISSNTTFPQKQSSRQQCRDAIRPMRQQKSSIYSFAAKDYTTMDKSVSYISDKQPSYGQAKVKNSSSNLIYVTKRLKFQSKNQTSEKLGRMKRQKQSLLSIKSTNYLDRTEKAQQPMIKEENKNNKERNQLSNLQSKKVEKLQVHQRLSNFAKKCECLKVQQIRQQQRELKELTLKPILNYTMNSKTTKRVAKKRNNMFQTYRSDVFQSLYNDASLYATKRQLERAIMEQQSKSVVIKSNRMKVNSTFEERLRLSIQKQANKQKRAQQKIDFDPQTGRKYFIPRTKPSKDSYSHHLSSRRISIALPEQQVYPARAAHYSKGSQKLNHSYEMNSTLNNSYERDLKKSLDSKYKIVRKPLQKENKLALLYADLLWSEEGMLKEQILTIKQANVLKNFLKEFKKYQQKYSKSINKQVFIALFKDFYSSLNLFDRWILDDRLKKQRKPQKSITSKHSQRFIDAFLLTHRKKSISGLNYHKARQYFV